MFILLKELTQCSDSMVDTEVVRVTCTDFGVSHIVFYRWWSSEMLPNLSAHNSKKLPQY